MLPPIRKASPPNIFCSVRSFSVATSSRIRSARSSSYAMAKPPYRVTACSNGPRPPNPSLRIGRGPRIRALDELRIELEELGRCREPDVLHPELQRRVHRRPDDVLLHQVVDRLVV